jgi:hypothetical protein
VLAWSPPPVKSRENGVRGQRDLPSARGAAAMQCSSRCYHRRHGAGSFAQQMPIPQVRPGRAHLGRYPGRRGSTPLPGSAAVRDLAGRKTRSRRNGAYSSFRCSSKMKMSASGQVEMSAFGDAASPERRIGGPRAGRDEQQGAGPSRRHPASRRGPAHAGEGRGVHRPSERQVRRPRQRCACTSTRRPGLTSARAWTSSRTRSLTGEPFSSIPRVSMRPPWVLPVACSLARNRTPKNLGRWRSISCWSDFSSVTDSLSISVTLVEPTVVQLSPQS